MAPGDQCELEFSSSKHEDTHMDSDSNRSQAGKLGDEQYPQGFKFVLLAGASIVSVFLIALDQTIVGTAIPKITDEFHSLNDVSWYAAAYFMTFGATQTSAGKIYKYFDLKWSYIISLLIFEVGSLLCGVAPNSKTLIIGRAIAGLGGAGLSVGGTCIITLIVAPPKRPIMLAFIGVTYALSAVLGPLLGGVFTDRASWRWCFYINLPIGGVVAVAIFFFLHLPAGASAPPVSLTQKLLHADPVGIVLALGGITSFILALQYGGVSYPWNSSVVIGLFIGFGLIIAALIAWEIWLGDYAMMLPRLYKQRTLTAPAAYQFFFMGSYLVLLYYLPIYFQSILGATPIQSGVYNLPLVLSAAVFALLGGVVVMKTGYPQQVMFAGSLFTTVAMGLIYTLDIGTPTGKWVGYQIFVGSCMAFAILHGLTIAQASVGPEDIAAVTANLLFFQTIGGAFSNSAGQSAFLNRLIAVLPETAPGVDPSVVIRTGASDIHNVFPPDVLPGVLQAYIAGLKAAFAVAIAFAGIAFLCSLAVPMRKLPTHTKGEAPMIAMG
ncbi:putative efflux pump antibiotic resistance protein [Xylariaceae sp. FL1651]|nr:putative efflux pump antibiotic resistance protein [Xylariaceae sp. FL1651]